MTPREEAFIAAGVKRTVIRWNAETSLLRKLEAAGADISSIEVQKKLHDLAMMLREER